MAFTLTKAVAKYLLTRGIAIHGDLWLWWVHIRRGAYGCHTAIGAIEITLVAILCGDDGVNDHVVVCGRGVSVT